jgi:hypothetical protein
VATPGTRGQAFEIKHKGNNMNKKHPLIENFALRELLARQYSGYYLYADDGQLQDNRVRPYIDFLKDTPSEIEEKMTERGVAAMEADVPRTNTMRPTHKHSSSARTKITFFYNRGFSEFFFDEPRDVIESRFMLDSNLFFSFTMEWETEIIYKSKIVRIVITELKELCDVP